MIIIKTMYLVSETIIKIDVWGDNLSILIYNFKNKISQEPYKLGCVLRNQLVIASDIVADLNISRYRCCELQLLDWAIIYCSNTVKYEQTWN